MGRMPGFLRRQRVRMGCVSKMADAERLRRLMELVQLAPHVKIGASRALREAANR